MAGSLNQNQRVVDKVEPILSAGAGVAAFVIGYILTMILLVIDNGDDLDGLFEGAGQVFYNAMFVPLDVGNGQFVNDSVNLLTDDIASEVFSLPTFLYHLVPILVIVLAGVFVVLALEETDFVHGAILGATVVVGFFVLALLGTFIFSSDFGSPDLVWGVVVAGIVYPVVFGAIGGIIGSQV